MALFGYVCSAHCKAKATANGIVLPVYEGERSRVEARRRRKAGWAVAGGSVAIAGLIGFWIWYVLVGSQPHLFFSVRFTDRASSGESVVCGNSQIVFLHGATLARYDTRQAKQIWSRELIQKPSVTTKDSELEFAGAAENLRLCVNGQNVWIATPGKLTRYDWNTGEPRQEIPLADGEVMLQGDEVLLASAGPGRRSITRVSLASGEKRTEEINETSGSGPRSRTRLATMNSLPRQEFAGLPPPRATMNAAAPLDPAKVAAQVQGMSLPARIALPATLAGSLEQQRIMDELNDTGASQPRPADNSAPAEDDSLIPLKDGCLQFTVRLVERRMVVRSAMKAPPAKSALSQDVKVTDTAAVANELINEMQRDRGGDKVTEDQSRYAVTLRRTDSKTAPEWTGEVVGSPGVIPLETVVVLAAGNTLRVFDQSARKLWEQTLTFNVRLSGFAANDAAASFGAGPCVEREGTLYVADEGVLTAFDLRTGSARWRLPTVGITGLFFDDQGLIYINTTTANLDTIKYSRQIDVTKKIDPVVLKADPKSGKTMWKTQPGGFINYVSGPFIYVVTSYPGDFDENGDPIGIDTGFQRVAFLNIKRLNPKNGSVMWTHVQQRCPLDVKFDRNFIQLVFRKEVQGLKFLTF